MKRKKYDKREILLSLVPGNADKIFDIGCAGGGLTKRFVKEGREVVGVDRDSQAIEKAKENLTSVFLADISQFEIPYAKKYFDCILYADILDCFPEPLEILKKHRESLCDQGVVVASFANIRYYKAIIRLVFGGTWDYTDGGILWRGHLRFFTLTNIKELFEAAGYEIIEIKRNIVAAGGFKFLNYLFFNKLKDFFTYQYFIKARKSTGRVGQPKRKRKIYKF